MPTRLVILSIGALFVASFLAVYGFLLAFDPALFLKFHDTFVDRSERGRKAEWRRHIHELQYKCLGLGFMGFGLFLMVPLILRGLGLG